MWVHIGSVISIGGVKVCLSGALDATIRWPMAVAIPRTVELNVQGTSSCDPEFFDLSADHITTHCWGLILLIMKLFQLRVKD